MLFLRSIVQAFLCSVTLVSATALPPAYHGPIQRRGNYTNSTGIISPKVFIFNAFSPEQAAFYGIPDFNLLAHNITVPGFSPKFPQAHCTANGEVCQLATGESEINAASTISALVYSNLFDLKKTYFLIAGIAGVNPNVATTGSVMLARFEVQVALQYEFDIRDIGDNFTTGYIPYGTKVPAPGMYPQDFYGTEVFEVNAALRDIAVSLASKATLNDTTAAQDYRANYLMAAAKSGPSVVACDGATSDVYYSGNILSEAFGNYTTLLTNGTGNYCSTAQEDSAMLEALMRADVAGKVDFGRTIVMRTAADFDRPPPAFSAYQHFFFENSGGFGPSIANLYLAGIEIINGIRAEWTSTFEAGIKPTNYIGDIFGTLGGVPDFGPYPYFGEA
ncbi:hypothetical protein P7C71_g5878, partial [Lecanoromycetidae sp. Uapishka_2]